MKPFKMFWPGKVIGFSNFPSSFRYAMMLPENDSEPMSVAKSIGKEYEFSAEAYYKEMKNIIAFREGASLFQALVLALWKFQGLLAGELFINLFRAGVAKI